MKISRNNYEECFLLYVDDELTEDQRRAVEAFVYANADLAEEFEMLKETKLFSNEEMNFDKTSLYKTSGNIINAANAEEFFLLQIDNELDEKEQAELKRFLLHHPEMEKEFLLLQQTVLPKEKIEFSNKEVLYKKEKDRRVVPFNLLKLSVAAAFIGALGLIWFLIPGKKEQNSVAENHSVIKKVAPAISTNNDSAVKNIQQNNIDKNSVAASNSSITDQNNSGKNKVVKDKKDEFQKNEQQQKQLLKNDVAENKNQLPKPIERNNADNNSNDQAQIVADNNSASNDAQITAEQKLADAQKRLDDANKIFAANTSNENNIVHPAVYHELNTDEDDKGVYIGSVELNKNKVRGFLKKASRIFGGKAKDPNENGDLKVANLDINTKTL